MGNMTGKPVAQNVRATWPFVKLIKEIKKLIRSDFGGQSDPTRVLLKKAKEAGLNWNDKDAQFVKDLVVEQISGCRKRVKHNVEEMLRRIEGA